MDVKLLLKKHDIVGEIVLTHESKENVIVVTSWWVILFSRAGEKVWEHKYHHGIIKDAKLNGVNIIIGEYGGNEYTLRVSDGVVVGENTLEKLRTKHGINESIVSVNDVGGKTLLCTELGTRLFSADGNQIWERTYHHDVITKAKLEGKALNVTEFDGGTYTLNIENGEEMKGDE